MKVYNFQISYFGLILSAFNEFLSDSAFTLTDFFSHPKSILKQKTVIGHSIKSKLVKRMIQKKNSLVQLHECRRKKSFGFFFVYDSFFFFVHEP